ncbi:MAG: DUF4256 domain-containing protein [Salegentibacter sp.]
MTAKRKLTSNETEGILEVLSSRFEKNGQRHQHLDWAKIQSRLEQNPEKLWSLDQMEKTGGEPDVLGYDETTDQYIFCDFSLESPRERRSICYDRAALEARKKYKPANTAKDLASEMGIRLMNESEYRELQALGDFDTKTSSWLETPGKIRELGGAIFGDFRYGQVFIYHNGADSYYAARGFRGILAV